MLDSSQESEKVAKPDNAVFITPLDPSGTEVEEYCRGLMKPRKVLHKTGWKNVDPSREGPAMNQLSSEIRTLQDKVNALSEEKEFYDPETVSSSGISHVPSRIPCTRGLLGRDSGWPHFSRNSMGTSGNVF